MGSGSLQDDSGRRPAWAWFLWGEVRGSWMMGKLEMVVYRTHPWKNCSLGPAGMQLWPLEFL